MIAVGKHGAIVHMRSKASNSGRFNRTERSWIIYDWANSAYATIIMAAVFPIYFASVAAAGNAPGDVYWGYGSSIATFTVAIFAPVLGAIGDFKGMKKRLFAIFLLIGLVFTTTMALTDNWKLMLIGYVFSYIGYSGSLLFYDSFITDVTTPERMDKLSAWGYAMGYIGGSTIPFLIAISLILFGESFGLDSSLAVKLSVLLCVVWWTVFSIPMLRDVKQVHFIEKPAKDLIKEAFRGIGHTVRQIISNRAMLVFMIAYFFYIDGVNTVIHMATVYGSSLGLGSQGMILALLVTQIVAVPCSIAFSTLARKFGSIRMITIAIAIYFLICATGFYMGFSLEPHQQKYEEGFVQSMQQTAGSFPVSDLSDADKTAWDEQWQDLLSQGKSVLAETDSAAAFNDVIESARGESVLYSDEGKLIIDDRLNAINVKISEYLNDGAVSAPYRNALSRSSMLFWAMAALVGTVQGGIQALSRSFFGKLVPPRRSNEFFGFFDIFGKFAAVMGPALYAFIAHATGRSSFGILSLLLLFAIGLTVMAIGRKHLQEAERQSLSNHRPIEQLSEEEQ